MTVIVSTMSEHPASHAASSPIPRRFLLWIDGVGAYLVCSGRQVTIGGPASKSQSADVSLLAGLGRVHVTLERSGETYLLHPHGRCTVGERLVEMATLLSNGQELTLGSNVRFRFRQPSPLSNSAALELLSDHRPTIHVEEILLFDETLLLGPGEDHHVVCRDWPNSVILFRRDDGLYCRSRGELFVSGERVDGAARLSGGSVVEGLDLRFRMEPIEETPPAGEEQPE